MKRIFSVFLLLLAIAALLVACEKPDPYYVPEKTGETTLTTAETTAETVGEQTTAAETESGILTPIIPFPSAS